jgi:hypothetical protein
MKKLFLMATAVAMIFSACTKEGGPKTAPSEGNLKVSITAPASRAIQAPGTAAEAAVNPAGNNFIFLVDGNGNVMLSEPLVTATAIDGTGQIITGVTSSWLVYVVLNAADASVGTLTTLAAVKAAGATVASVQTLAPTGFVPMSNTGDAVSMVPTADPLTSPHFESEINVAPVLTRLELGSITGGTWTDPAEANNRVRIDGFDVTGVYVDNYYQNFTYGGVSVAPMFQMNQTFVTTGIGDGGPWTAASTPPVVNNGAQVWAYNLAPGAAPHLVIRVTNVATSSTINGGTDWVNGGVSDAVRFLTVSFASDPAGNTPIVNFARGSIYQVAGITFYSDNLHTSPNPLEVDLSVEVTVLPWTLTPTYGVVQ